MNIKIPQLMVQKNMLRVLLALMPVLCAAVYFFGWRVVSIIAVSAAVCFITEWIMATFRKGKISTACFVTALLFALSLPATIPLWMVAVGAFVAILFGKEAFGGFGKNIFNPAIVGRAFIYVCFPTALTAGFTPVFKTFPAGLVHWNPLDAAKDYSGLLSDAATAATPMLALRDFSKMTDWGSLFIGNIGDNFIVKNSQRIMAAGSIGEVSGVLLLLCGAYLVASQTANWKLVISSITGAAVTNILLRNVLGISAVPPLLFTMLSGALLYTCFFMVTDPVSAPKMNLSQWIYGLFIGSMIVLLRYKAIFAGAVGFAVLLGNMLSPSLDLWIKRFNKKPAESVK